MVADLPAVKYLTEKKDAIPAAQQCEVGPLDESHAGDAKYMGGQVLSMVQSGKCPAGVYAMENFLQMASN